MRHTYLLQPGEWIVEGFFVDAEGGKRSAKGTSLTEHGPDLWTSDGRIAIGDDEPIATRYELLPLAEGEESTSWSSYDPVEGVVRGTIAVVEELLISSFVSESGGYHGVDVLRKSKNDRYLSRGFAMRNGKRLSSWALALSQS